MQRWLVRAVLTALAVAARADAARTASAQGVYRQLRAARSSALRCCKTKTGFIAQCSAPGGTRARWL
jgi:hypothetical protein